MENMELSKIVKEQREKIGISQRELARRINVNNKTIYNIENGEIKKPNFLILMKLSNELKLNLYTLVLTAGYDKKEIKIKIDLMAKILKEFL